MQAVDRFRNGTGGLEAGMAQKEQKNILKEYLEINMRMWDNTKMDVKETSLVFDFILHYNTGKRGIC